MDTALGRATELVKGFEGFRSRPYQDDTGRWTIGYGSTYDLEGNPVSASAKPVTVAQGEALLERLLAPAEAFVRSHVNVTLNDAQTAALTSFVYNLGDGDFESSTLLRKLNAGDYSGAADEFLRWNRSGGRVVAGLVTRRETERRVFLS